MEEDKMPSSTSTQRCIVFDTFSAILTHYVSPGRFYVKNINDQNLDEKIKYQIEESRSSLRRLDWGYGIHVPGHDFCDPDQEYQDQEECQNLIVHVSPGDLVLAPWIADSYNDDLDELAPYDVSLRRAKVKLKKVVPEMGLYLKVFYIDYGNTRWVHWKEIRKVPSLELKRIDHMAIGCRLDGCYPTLPSNMWTYEAVNSIKKYMKDNIRLRIQVDDFDEFSVNNVRVEVDNPSRDNFDPIILNRFLFMTKLASCQKTRLFGRWNIRELPKIPMDTGGIHWVRISHVEDPDLIYVQHLDIVGYEGELLETLKAEFEELIPDWHAEELNRSPNSCIVGELYVYKSPNDGKMYRVMIEKILSKKPLVQIFSLDYGWRQICYLRDVTLLPDEPFRFALEYSTRLSQRVYLDNLEPCNPFNGWESRCCNHFRRLLKSPSNQYLMYVTNAQSGAVLLFEYIEEENKIISIGEELIRKLMDRRIGFLL